jgi:hypothetical protein
MKKIKKIIIALVCSIGLFAATMTTTAPTITAAEPALPQNCHYISWNCCGGFHWGDYDFDDPYTIIDILVDFLDSCMC